MCIQVLLAVFNGERFIEEQVASILNQSYSDIHLVIRDNASCDNTVKILKRLQEEHPEKITVLFSETNDGVIGNFARLAEYATAPYVMFSDADDVWNKDKIALSFEKMQDLENIYGKEMPLLVHSDLKVVDKELQEIHPSFWSYSRINPENTTLSRQLVQNVVTGCTTLINRSLLKISLPFPDHIIMHDWWLGLVAIVLGKVSLLPTPTMLYRQHGGNDTGAKRYGLFSLIQRFRNAKEKEKIIHNNAKKYLQALALKSRFQNELSLKDLKIIEDFLRLPRSSFLKKRYLMYKHGFLKQGFLRNAFEFLPTEWLLRR